MAVNRFKQGSPGLESVSPEKAAELLANRAGNRPVRQAKVRAFARDILAQRWMDNGQTLSIGTDGKLLDGQHRLLAIIEAGKTVSLRIVRGVNPAAFRTIDSGSARSFGDVLSIQGEASSSTLSAAVRFLAVYRMRDGKNIERGGQSPGASLTHQELSDALASEPDIRASLPFAKVGTMLGSGSALWVFLHYLLSRRDSVLAELFFEGLYSGTNLKEDDPILLLRQQILRWRTMQRSITATELAGRVIRTWNHTRKGNKISKIQVKEGDELPEIA